MPLAESSPPSGSPKRSVPGGFRLIRNARSRVRRIAGRSFGQRRLRIQTVAFEGGSIHLWLVVSTVMATAYLFFKDDEDVRKGFNLFSADLRASGRRLRRYFERFGRHKP
ncbi:MAG TPA: hypothetical protein VHG93_12140 [Longimicrobium sp.]|nr:hypothetical protein [Longimicrobium sp.]